jgi:CBS domain-containing protein
MTIGEAIKKVGSIPYLAVPGGMGLEEVAGKLLAMRQIRGVYVVDEQGRLQGVISLGLLISRSLEDKIKPTFHARSLLERITADTAMDIMESRVISARTDDDIQAVLDRMIQNDIKEIPVIDEQKKIVGNLGIIDLWKLAEK